MATDRRTNKEMVEMIAQLAQAVEVDAIICIAGSEQLPQLLQEKALPSRLIAATADEGTCALLSDRGFNPIQLPLQAADKYSQVRHALSVALRLKRVAVGEPVLCAIGAIFMLGDTARVLDGAEQPVPNPFYGHDKELRQITNPEIHDALVEFAKLDGTFVVRADGYIESAGVFLAADEEEIEIPSGLGARHMAAASTTARTDATAIVVSATDGNVRVFDDGRQILQMAPDLPYGPLGQGEDG